MNKLRIAEELLKNTTPDQLGTLLKNYIFNMRELKQVKYKEEDEKLARLYNCIAYIEKENFDITGWALVEIPISFCYCFYNKSTDESFDLKVWDTGRVVPIYLDNEQDDREANSIQEAIEKYVTPNLKEF
ncbi:hypothetical protein ACU3L3_14200 [Priestia endophytica]